ncbi:alpha/beta hydrolase [Ferrimonas senticii]|uniref:alpha/beta hydrolase n=1 Tax=Ferrimonas senticii TaxID=394566 RepID=UPI0004128E0C|nr:alpha/beta fold hydrolase [Ferrimonas senticii]
MKALLLLPLLLLGGCQTQSLHPLFVESEQAYPSNYGDFAEYAQQTRAYLAANRYFLTDNHAVEIAANAPREWRQNGEIKGGVLLVHGLGDAPFSMSDIAETLYQQGYLVRTVLLPGHGTRPGDMLKVDHRDWQRLVQRHTELLAAQVDRVYLGGFSTGGNLVTSEAYDNDQVDGLLLFSPAFKTNEPLIALTPLLSHFKDWLETPNAEAEINYTRYMGGMPINGFAQYYRTSEQVMSRLDRGSYGKPTLMVLSEHDSILDTLTIAATFAERFSHPDSRLIWFGEQQLDSPRTLNLPARYPDYRITNMSHMGMLYQPQNPYFGIDGNGRICDNGQQQADAMARCQAGEPVWFSAWGTNEPGKIHARTTFNPEYELMRQQMLAVLQSQ